MVDPQVPVELVWGVRVPLRDGVCLNATLYLPRFEPNPVPAIFTMTPYIAQTYHDRGWYFAVHGYPFLIVDVRGRGNSQGVFQPLINEANDAADVIQWLAKQTYCNGRVAMWGGSYGGYVQWAAAKECPPNLASIVPVAAPCAGVDFPGRGNRPTPYLMQWLTLVWGRTSQEQLFWGQEHYWGRRFCEWFESGASFAALDAQLGSSSPIFQEWLAHPHQEEYWDRLNPTQDQYARLSIPVLTITGCYDGDQPGALAHYRAHRQHNPHAQHCLIIGPWDHAGTRTPALKFAGVEVGQKSLIDMNQLHLDWYTWTLLDGPRPAFLQKDVACYVMEADCWRYADQLDDLTAWSEPWYLHSDGNPTDVFRSGRLNTLIPAQDSEPDHYVHDPRDVSLARLESTVDPQDRSDSRMIYAATGRQLVYHSEPFAVDTEITGFFKLSAWLSINQPDTDLSAVVYEVRLDGSVLELTNDCLRARYRESLREPQLIDTLEPLQYCFEGFMFVSRLIRKGHRLRLVFGPQHSIYNQRNYQAGGVVAEESVKDTRTVIVKLLHDAKHPSVLRVPFGAAEEP